MNKNDPIVIERTANGWFVRPQYGEHSIACIADCRVFNHLEYDQQGVTSELTVWGFLQQHFSKHGGDHGDG